MPDIELIVTSDGSHSLRNTRLNETYHSVHGAIQESEHVFIANGLAFLASANHSKDIRILEVGFGTGLNALLTARYALGTNRQIHYTAFETDPVPSSVVQQLNYPKVINVEGCETLFQKLHTTKWSSEERVSDHLILNKQLTRLQDALLGREVFDLVFFDAFAPVKQPDLWEISVLSKVEKAMKHGAVLVTYCARGQLKRDLKSLALRVETLPGPPGKKEMVRALKS